MKKAIAVPAIAYLAACAAMFACSENSLVPDPGDPIDPDAKVTSLLSQLDAGSNAAASSMSSGGTAGAPAPTGSQDSKACTYSAETKRTTCPTKTMPNGMTHDLYFQLLDAQGNAQETFDTATTVGIRRVADRSGTLNQPLMTQTGPVNSTQQMTVHEDMVLSGLKTATPMQNGTGTMRNVIDRSDRPPPGDTVEVTQTFTNIFIDPAPTGPKYPKGGTITATVVNKMGNGSKTTTTQVTTYDGSTIAKTVITPAAPGAQTRTCTYDMTKQAPPTCTTP
jgi:hypothetical protein